MDSYNTRYRVYGLCVEPLMKKFFRRLKNFFSIKRIKQQISVLWQRLKYFFSIKRIKQQIKRLFKRLKRLDYRHYICVGITLVMIFTAIFGFPYAFGRLIESIKDFGLSIAYYFQSLFTDKVTVKASVIEYSEFPLRLPFNLPSTWIEFKAFMSSYWQVFFKKETIVGYFSKIGTSLYNLCYLLLLLMPLVLVGYILFSRLLNKQNNNYNEDSKPLKIFKKIVSVTITPANKWLKDFIAFVKEHGYYFKLWLWITAYAFSFITIFIEFIAFYFYFVVSFDLLHVYTQVVKLFLDLSAMIDFIPPLGWLIIGATVVNFIRRKIGYKRLYHNENKNKGFINARPIVVMGCGTVGTGKTSLITDMALSEDVMLRQKAFELLLENDTLFPNFPWINLENGIKLNIKRHRIYNLATCKKYISFLRFAFENRFGNKAVQKSVLRHLKRYYGFSYGNLIFDYDYEKYGLYRDNKLELKYVWEVLKSYTQLYFIYVVQSSLIIGNYSVRTDSIMSDEDNFPMWDTDFFKRDSRYLEAYSRHAKILDFDALRLGRKVLQDNPNKDSFEFGVVLVTEIGKERGNNLENVGMKKSDDTTNPKNDLFNQWLKMVRHSSTVDNFPFVKVLTDDQRPSSWGADARDLCEIVRIKERSETELLMPLFALGELFHDFVYSKFADLYYRYRYSRGDNTLTMYLLKGFVTKFHNYYTGIYNTFGTRTLTVLLEDGSLDGTTVKGKYYLSVKKLYSKRFATDSFGDYYTEKCARSYVGLADLREYVTERASFDELALQNSYWINDIRKWM